MTSKLRHICPPVDKPVQKDLVRPPIVFTPYIAPMPTETPDDGEKVGVVRYFNKTDEE